jgi:RNA polymerase sigma-70 factor (ECF subfamily)
MTFPRAGAESDAELLQAVAQGSETAFAELRARYGRAVERACRPFAGRDAEDCAQEVFARVWRKAQLFDPSRGSVAAWLLTLARRTALNFQPVRMFSRPGLESADVAGIEAAELDRLWLRTAMARLPGRERRVIELAYFAGMSQAEIAAELGAPLGSVKSWTRRGLNRLAVQLKSEDKR